MLLVVLANRRYATLHEARDVFCRRRARSFTIEPPVLDFSGLAKLYSLNTQAPRVGRADGPFIAAQCADAIPCSSSARPALKPLLHRAISDDLGRESENDTEGTKVSLRNLLSFGSACSLP